MKIILNSIYCSNLTFFGSGSGKLGREGIHIVCICVCGVGYLNLQRLLNVKIKIKIKSFTFLQDFRLLLWGVGHALANEGGESVIPLVVSIDLTYINAV